jgi:hypothetical protein
MDKDKQPMKSRVQAAEWRKRRTINEIRWWSEGLNPDIGLAGKSSRPMVSREIGRWRNEKAVIKKVCQKESMVEAGQSTIDDGSNSRF